MLTVLGMRAKLLFLVFATAVLFGTAGPSAASDTSQERLSARIGIGSQGIQPFLPIELAAAMGYFEDENLEIDIRYLQSSSNTLAALHANQVDFTGNGVGEVLDSTLAGKPVSIVASFAYNPGMVMAVPASLANEIKTLEDLKGRRIGVSSLRSGTHLLVSAMLASAGLTEQDVQLVAIGVNTAPAAIKAKQVDAAALYDPFATIMKNSGEVVWIADLATTEDVRKYLGGDYQFTALLTTPEIIDTKPELVQRVVNALYRACRYIATHSAEEIAAAMPEEIVGSNSTDYIQGVDHLKPAFASHCEPSLEGIKNSLAAQVKAGFRTQEEIDRVTPESVAVTTFVEAAIAQHGR